MPVRSPHRRSISTPIPSSSTVSKELGNVGSILRSAVAACFRQALLSADCADAWSPKALRAAMGAHFRIDLHEASYLAGFLGAYRGQRVAMLPAAATNLYLATLAAPMVWVFGG